MSVRKPRRRANIKLKVAIVESEQAQYRIAERAGIDVTLLNAYANGRRKPTRDHQRDLAKVLHKRIADLFQQEDAG